MVRRRRAGRWRVAMSGGGLGRIFVWAAIGLVCLVLVPFVLFSALLGASSAAGCGAAGAGAITPGAGAKGLPPQFIPIYAQAAAKYHLGPQGFGILAAIHEIENGFSPQGGPTSSAGAVGPMQFLPSTWAVYGQDGNGDGKKDINNVWDAIFGAANYLHASGLRPGATEAQVRNAILAYNHSDAYVSEVLAKAAVYNAGISGEVPGGALALVPGAGAAGCSGASGPANLQDVETLYQPRSYRMLPARLMAGGRTPEAVDARIWDDVVWLADNYDLQITAAREAGHASHGNGTSVDWVPRGSSAVAHWQETTERLARDIGWRPGCDSSCAPPVIAAPGWVRWIGYNGDPAHGDPAHCSGSCGPHLHISWQNSDGAQSALVAPAAWVKVFPVGSGQDPTSLDQSADKGDGNVRRKKGKR